MSEPNIIPLTATVVQATEIVSTSVEGQTALLNITSGAYFGLDRIGSRIWELIAQPRTVAALVDQLVVEFVVDRPMCEAHVQRFLHRLAAARLLQVTDAPPR